MPGRIDVLLRAYARSGGDAALTAATGTLDGMARGGMYDQIGGGSTGTRSTASGRSRTSRRCCTTTRSFRWRTSTAIG